MNSLKFPFNQRVKTSIVRNKISQLKSILITIISPTNKKRWQRVAHEGPAPWDFRNEKIASFIPPNSSVLDLGCGAQTLRKHIISPSYYQPCDLIKSTDDVILCDFNSAIYPEFRQKFSHVIVSGVLEYIIDYRNFIKFAVQCGDKLIISYNLLIDGSSKAQRMTNNWVNHLSRNQLESYFHELGLEIVCLHFYESSEIIYCLSKKPS
jgi:hypothetical protein